MIFTKLNFRNSHQMSKWYQHKQKSFSTKVPVLLISQNPILVILGGTLVLKLFCLCRYQFDIWCEFLKFNLVNIIYNDQNPFYCDFSILGKNPGPNGSAAQHSLLVKLFCPLSEDTDFLHVILILNLETFLYNNSFCSR